MRVRLGAEGTSFMAGTVDRIGREVDRQTHELRVDVLLNSPPERIAVGQRADVWIELERKAGAVRLPLTHLQRDAEGTYCFVDRGGRIARVPVRLGIAGTDVVEVAAGLSPGDTVLAGIDGGAALSEDRIWSKAKP